MSSCQRNRTGLEVCLFCLVLYRYLNRLRRTNDIQYTRLVSSLSLTRFGPRSPNETSYWIASSLFLSPLSVKWLCSPCTDQQLYSQNLFKFLAFSSIVSYRGGKYKAHDLSARIVNSFILTTIRKASIEAVLSLQIVPQPERKCQ